MKKFFSCILVVVALVGVNAAVVSADGGNALKSSVANEGIGTLSHGVDH